MLNNIRYIQKTLREENKKVTGTDNCTSIKKQGREKEGGSTFKDTLKDIKKKKDSSKIKKDNIEVNEIEEDIIIASTLGKLIEENQKIERLVIERFSKYPSLRGRLNIKDKGK